MKSSKHYSNEKMVENGKAMARGMRQENMQHEKNMAKAGRRRQTMLENAAEEALSGRA